MLEFKVNEFITLKLENSKTFIYVNNELFNQCISVFTRTNTEELEDLLEIESVDELAEKSIDDMTEDLDPELINIPAKVRFWVHCSNMQVWAENNYDSRLIHSNLAFPLLKKLMEVGDVKAKRVFKEEIAKRLKFGSYWTQKFLFIEGYVSYLTQEELINSVLVPIEANTIMEISKLTCQDYMLITSFDDDEFRHRSGYNLYFSVKNGHVIELELVINKPHAYIPKVVKKFKELHTLYIYIGLTDEKIPDFNVKLKSLKNLKIISQGNVTLPDVFDNFPNLVNLLIRDDFNGLTSFESIPETIGSLSNLSRLEINKISLKSLPSSIGNLKMLDWLIIKETGLESLPTSIYDLEYIDHIVLEGNPLKTTSEIKNLEKKFEEKVYNFIKERTLIGLGTSVKDLKEVFEVLEYKIHNKLLRLKNNSRIYESSKEIYYTKNS